MGSRGARRSRAVGSSEARLDVPYDGWRETDGCVGTGKGKRVKATGETHGVEPGVYGWSRQGVHASCS